MYELLVGDECIAKTFGDAGSSLAMSISFCFEALDNGCL
jgi:hypothetical protein